MQTTCQKCGAALSTADGSCPSCAVAEKSAPTVAKDAPQELEPIGTGLRIGLFFVFLFAFGAPIFIVVAGFGMFLKDMLLISRYAPVVVVVIAFLMAKEFWPVAFGALGQVISGKKRKAAAVKGNPTK